MSAALVSSEAVLVGLQWPLCHRVPPQVSSREDAGHAGESPTLMASLGLDYVLEGPVSPYSPTGLWGFNIRTRWGDTVQSITVTSFGSRMITERSSN